jgi:YrbI family 3-deoxy-D-manno-octulosonate 8-phosphate phosphatase
LSNEYIAAKARKIKLIVTDIDGVWTDAKMYYSPSGETMKAFSTYDGMATWILRKSGMHIAIITGENSPIVAARAAKLKIEDVHLGIMDKLEVLEGLMDKYGLSSEQVAYIGDDVNDLECMRVVGLSASPANTPVFHLLQPDILLERNGGDGAFREFADLILAARE